MRYALLTSVLALFYTLTLAQTDGLKQLKKDPVKEKALLEALALRFASDVKSCEGNYKKFIAEIYKERYEGIRERFTENEIVTDPKASAYLEKLLVEIAKANPQINIPELRVVFSRAWWPNASSMGEGTILFNIGLFNRFSSEAQAAFVLCHELSHYYLNHGNNSIRRYVNMVNDPELQARLKKIQKSEYRQNQQVEDLSKGMAFNSRRHSREFEHAADSMALELMRNTGYDLEESLSCLALLDSVDRCKYNAPLDLSHRLDFAAYRFKPRWLQADGLMFSISRDHNAAEEDSLKTHPDCSKRIAMIKDAVTRWNRTSAKKFLVSEPSFRELSTAFDLEALSYCVENKRISKALYLALKMAPVRNEAAVHALVGNCFNMMYQAQKNHDLGKIVDLPGPDYDPEYNELLQMIQNLRLSEIAALSYHYMQQQAPKFESDPAFAAAWKQSKENQSK